MRQTSLVFLLAGLFSLCTSSSSTHQDDNTKNPMVHIKSILRTWNPYKPIRFAPEHTANNEQEQGEEIYHRRKRSANFEEEEMHSIPHMRAALPTSKACQIPGYTGEYCEFPICPDQNMYVPDDPANSENGAPIDAAVIANCSQRYVTMVDNTMYWITYEIESDPPLNPTFYVMGEDGQVFSPDNVDPTPSSYRAFFNMLPPGQYVIVPSADLPQSVCVLTMQARTDMTVVSGFLSGSGSERSDYPERNYAYFDTNSIVAVHANRLRIPGDLRAISIHGGDNYVTRPKLLRPRYNCSYEYIYESFWCPNERGQDSQSYYVQVEGTTHMGYHFRRIQPFRCVLAPATSPTPTLPPTPSPTAPTSCMNDGVLINPLEGDPYCYCIGLYGGADCSRPLCQNNGWLPNPDTDTRCSCPTGYSGIHCQHVLCQDNSGNEFNAENPSFILVIRTRSQLSDVIEQVLNSTNALMDSLSFAPNYIADYILVLFNNDKLLVNERYSKYGDMQTRLTQAMHSEPSDGACTDSVFGAIATALSQYPNSKSPLYVFTDGGPDDTAMANDVLHLQSYWRSPIHLFFVQPNLADGCSVNPEDPGYRDLLNVAEKASGTIYWFPQQTRSKVGNYYLQHALHTFYRAQLMLSNDIRICSNQAVYKPISVDVDVDRLVITATGTNLTLMMTGPQANRVAFDEIYNDGINYIWQKNGVIAGQWFITLLSSTSQSSCSFKVYQKSFDVENQFIPDFDMFFSFTEAIMSDGFQMQPIYNWNAAPVMHITNYNSFIADTSRVYANLQIYASRNGNQTEVYASNGMFRDACSFHFYFNAFTCQVPEETLYFNLFVRDRLGMTLQRAGTMFCSRINVTPPPSHICQNGGVMNPSNNTCFCYPGYTGTYCQDIVCYNGGTPQGTQCGCPAGWTGTFCEIPRCTQKGFNPEGLRYGVDMIFAVEITQQGLASLAMLDKNIEEVIRDVQFQDFRWIRQFVLVGFNSTWGGIIATAPASNPSAVINAMHNISQTVPSDTGCPVQLWAALDSAVFQRDTPPGSFVEVFQTSPENDNDTFNLNTFYEWARLGQLNVYGFLSALPSWQPNGLACNATFDQFNTIFDVAASARGMTYVMQPAEIQYATRAIPMQFSNGLVYGQQADDCTGKMLYAYFPVDAYAQTLIVNAWGANMDIKLYTGAGDQWDYDIVWQDNWLDYAMIEARRPCDPDWDQVGQYCIKFVAGTDGLNWTDAEAYCKSTGGYLVDDLTSDKNTFLYQAASKNSFWIGLFNNGSGYMWDRGAYTPAALDQTTQFWKNGDTPPPYDANNPCVYFDGAASDSAHIWTLDSCSTVRNFVCQKHRYDQDYHPASLESDLLPPGYWYVTIKTSPNATNGGDWPGCAASVRVQSSLQIVTGFVTDISSDDFLADPIQDSVVNRISTFVYSEEHEAKVPIMTDAILVDAYNLTFYNGLKYQARLGCTKPWITQTFACPNADSPGNEFAIAHKGEDERGFAFSRITFGHCSQEELFCGNGGVRWNGTCVCDDFWTGMYCTVPICVNGGTRDPSDRFCQCPPGYTGRNCEFTLCQPPAAATFTNDQKSLVFIVETTQNNKQAAQTLSDNLPAIIGNATQNNPSWFQNYALVTFDSSGVKSSNFDFNDANSLQQALNTQISQISDNGNCNMALFGVLQQAMAATSNIAYPNSEVIMVTMAGVNDANNRVPSIQEVSASRVKLHYVFINGTCGQAPSNDSMNYLARLAYGSSGNVLVVIPENVGQLLTAYVPTLYAASTLTHPTGHTGFTCPAGNWFVQVDRNTTQIFITSSSEYGSVTAVNPLNQMVSPNVLFNDGNQKVYSLDVNNVPGIYKLSLSSPGYCFAHVYSTGGAKIYPRFSIATADDPTGAHIDGSVNNPLTNNTNIVNFHMVGRLFTRGYLQYVDIYDPDTLTLILRSELYERFDCSYQFYSDPFTCSSEMLGVFIYGVDEYNQQFRRQEIAYCLNGSPPPVSTTSPQPGQTSTSPQPGQTSTSPQPGQTSTSPTSTPPQGQTSTSPNGQQTTASNAPPATSSTSQPIGTTPTGGPLTTTFGPNSMAVDVVFLIDMSSEATNYYNDFSQFLKTVTIPWTFTVDGSRARVALTAVYVDDPVNTNSLNSMGSRDVFLNSVNTFFTDWSDDRPGQAIARALTYVSAPEYLNPSNGYRSSISNHVLIYLTATDNFVDDPTAVAQNIRSNNVYGILAIGYGPGVTNQTLFKTMAGGDNCATFPANSNDLNKATVSWVQNAVWTAASGGANYCN